MRSCLQARRLPRSARPPPPLPRPPQPVSRSRLLHHRHTLMPSSAPFIRQPARRSTRPSPPVFPLPLLYPPRTLCQVSPLNYRIKYRWRPLPGFKKKKLLQLLPLFSLPSFSLLSLPSLSLLSLSSLSPLSPLYLLSSLLSPLMSRNCLTLTHIFSNFSVY